MSDTWDLDDWWQMFGWYSKDNAIRSMNREGIRYSILGPASSAGRPPSNQILMDKEAFQKLCKVAPRPLDDQIREALLPPPDSVAAKAILDSIIMKTAIITDTSARDTAIACATSEDDVALAHTLHHRKIWPHLIERDKLVDKAFALDGVKTELMSYVREISMRTK